MVSVVLLAVAGPFLISLVATLCVRSWARRRGSVDRPGGHKQHSAPVALGGGIAITLAIVLPLVVGTVGAYWMSGSGDRDGSAVETLDAGTLQTQEWRFPGVALPELVRTHLDGIADRLPTVLIIVAGALLLHIVGLIDDRTPLGALPKFGAQLIAAALPVFLCDVRALELLPAPLSAGVTILWIVLITNAFNFLDNMDGLSVGVAAIAAGIFATAAMTAGQIFVPVMAWVLVGALLGFLGFNFAPASIYMGDSGSLVIGYLLAVITVLTTFFSEARDLQWYGVFVPLAVLAVPLYDVASVCWLRIRAGDNPFRGDQRHFSHRLVRRGMSVRTAVLTIYLATATTGMSALILPRAKDWSLALLAVAQCVCVVLIIALLEHGDNRSESVQSAPGAEDETDHPVG